MAGINLSLRTIERSVSGSYNVGSLRLNADNKLEHVNSHVFKANGDHVTKEQNEAVRKAIDSSFRNAYAGNSRANTDLRKALGDVKSFLLGDAEAPGDDTLHTELSRDEVRALLKGLYRINKGGEKNIAEGKRWIEKAKVIRELKAGRIGVDNDYNLIGRDERGSTVLSDYKDACGIQSQEVVKLSKDFLRGCWRTGTTKRWGRAIKFGTGEKKSVEIVSTGKPAEIGTWLKDRLVLEDKKVRFDTTGWGPLSCEMAEVMAKVVNQKFNAWFAQKNGDDKSPAACLEKVNALVDDISGYFFLENKAVREMITAKDPLSSFNEVKAKEDLKAILLRGCNDQSEETIPGLHTDFLRACEDEGVSDWLEIDVDKGMVPKDNPYKVTALKSDPSVSVVNANPEGDEDAENIHTSNGELVMKMGAIKDRKVRKMTSFVYSHVFASAVLGSLDIDENERMTFSGGKPFAGYQRTTGKKGTGNTWIQPQTPVGDPATYGKVSVKVKKNGEVTMTIRRLVTPALHFKNAARPGKTALQDTDLRKPVCVEYKVKINPGPRNGDPRVEVTSAKILPNVSKLEKFEVKG